MEGKKGREQRDPDGLAGGRGVGRDPDIIWKQGRQDLRADWKWL